MFDLDKWWHRALQLAVTDIFHRLAPDAKSIVDLYSGNELEVGGCAAGSGGNRLSARAKVVALDRDARAARKWYQRGRHTSHNGIAVFEPVAENVGHALPTDNNVLAWAETRRSGAEKCS